MKWFVSAVCCMGLLCQVTPRSASAREKKSPLQVTVVTKMEKEAPVVTLTVTNVSKTYQIFQSISCSWQDYWQTDDKNALVADQEECGKNALYTVILAPGEKHVERPTAVLFRGKPGQRTFRFGYTRHVSNFTSDELKKVYNSPERIYYFSNLTVAARFKPEKETFWSDKVTIEANRQSILR